MTNTGLVSFKISLSSHTRQKKKETEPSLVTVSRRNEDNIKEYMTL